MLISNNLKERKELSHQMKTHGKINSTFEGKNIDGDQFQLSDQHHLTFYYKIKFLYKNLILKSK
jgi:hypothetical protein